jgi:hypothetical protein
VIGRTVDRTVDPLDIHSTQRALGRGGREANRSIRPLVGSPVAFTLVKAGSAAATIYLVEKVRKKNRAVAIATMVGINSAYAVIVARNYRIRD